MTFLVWDPNEIFAPGPELSRGAPTCGRKGIGGERGEIAHSRNVNPFSKHK